MAYIKINTDETLVYPYTLSQLKNDNPNISFPENILSYTLSEFNVFYVNRVSPGNNPYMIYIQTNPILLNAIWYENWLETEMSSSEIELVNSVKWSEIRTAKNQYLSDSDWTQLYDSPLTTEKKQDWLLYRQSLRRVTLQADPFNITWPVKPTY